MKVRHFVSTLAFAAATALPFAVIADTADTAANKAFAIEALTETLAKGNPEAVDTYFDPGYIQHNPDVPNGSDGLKGMISMLAGGGNFKADFARVIADGDMVAFHGRYEGFGETPMIAFDVFRLEDGKIVEHWDNLIPEQPLNPSGHSQIDGATEITDLDKTVANKAKVLDFINKSLIAHEEVNITDYISPVTYTQHNPMVADGLEGFGAFMQSIAEKGISMEYAKVHHVIGEGNFVLTLSEGAFGGEPQAYYDLFRLEDGLIVEHWDVIAPMPGPDAKHNDAGKF
ncbi:nuclear transport factor 2 family protein [Tropicimonas sp. TH_r6]|uniref:nuclear transport factor 2 family protein n=1 Tax=Tropicimonas sp. TH_r6 TaxID=3082085 RepID=UPI0029547C09|nr:nuclear transport factor 2 family protein [Tropicimonas sp. TH_r6]MDV7143607.1 nuclear transport factor 2 family protein [Tropicimonas sp. TH_r6]